MPTIEIDDALWAEYAALCDRLGIQDHVAFLHDWCRRIIRDEGTAEGRYWLIATTIVTRADSEILLVGNDYGREELVWHLPGGSVNPGEDLRHAAVRELYEETGIEALSIGRLAWVSQNGGGPDATGLLVFEFEVTAWQGEVTMANEERGGHVRRAEFLSYAEACARAQPETAGPLRDWIAAPHRAPRFYWRDERTKSGLQLMD